MYNNPQNKNNNYVNRPNYNNTPAFVAPMPEELPADYTEAADRVIQSQGSSITSTKLRNFFSLFCDMYNDVNRSGSAQLTETQINELTGARIRIIYECGRDNKVKTFTNTAKLINYLMGIGNSSRKFLDFYHYFEALVAYHRYYGNR